MNERRRWDAFISYGHSDGEWVRVLASNLHREGFEIFLDIWEVGGGDRVTGRLEEGLRHSRNGILVCSPEALARPWVIEEYEVLLRQAVQEPSRRLIPVLMADTELPPFLANRRWVDFRSATTEALYNAALAELIRGLRGQSEAERPDRASSREWPASASGRVRPAGQMSLTLQLSRTAVTLTGGGEEVTQRPRGLQRGTRDAVLDLARLRSRHDADAAVVHRGPTGQTVDGVLADVGRRLTADFLGGAVGEALAARVAQVESLGERAELGLDVEAELTDLPWESLVLPGPDGTVPDIGGSALVLHHNLAVYRAVSGLGPTPAYKVRGPLRILVAIGSPESQNQAGELLNYEAELARIVRSVEDARRGGSAYVRVLHRGTLAAIKRALAEDPEGFHVLHLSCHAGPGVLILEDEDGKEDRVTAARLVDEGVPAGSDLPLVMLAGCATGLQVPATEGKAALVSMAEDLTRRGVPQVLAMQAPVSDLYATELAGELYRWLATAQDTDTLVALAEARRACERRRQKLPPESPRRGSPEWATPALLVRGPRLPLYNRDEASGPIRISSEPALAEGVVVRGVGEFVGRRQEEREARRALTSTKAGLVIHGIGGVGKSTLSAELVREIGSGMVVASKAGGIGIDTLLEEVGMRLGQFARDAGPPGEDLARAAQDLRRSEIDWEDRWSLLSQILKAVPVLVLLDNFEDNLSFVEGKWGLRDPEVADLLGRWTRFPGDSKLLFTSRHPFTLPSDAQRRLATLHLGPLSPAETTKLMWQLPGLDALTSEDRARAYQDVGGHPRTLEYLDALLRGGDARFEDVAERMEWQLTERGIMDPQAWLGSENRSLNTSLAEAVTFAVDDVVLRDLLEQLSQTPLARELVVGASVYRHPVDETALAWQLGVEVESPPDPARRARIERVHIVYAAAIERKDFDQSIESLGLTPYEVAQYTADIADETRPPLQVPIGIEKAVDAAASAGLLSPATRGDEPPLLFVHRWTARAIGDMEPAMVRAAHAKAARFWRWRVDTIPQSGQQDIEQLIEARFHHLAAGDSAGAVALTDPIVRQLRTSGHYGRAAELCRQALGWVTEGSREAGELHGLLGVLAYVRGDLVLAEARYGEAISILEALDNEVGAATNYANLALVAEDRGDYETARVGYLRAISIQERVGDDHNAAANYTNLGNLAARRGDYDDADAYYRQSLEIQERLDHQAGIARSYGNLGGLAVFRGDYDDADAYYRQALEVQERMGNQAEMATSFGNLGTIAQRRGNYDGAEARYRQALEIQERLGDQAGMATSFGNLGSMAQRRGDYDGAEARFRQALEIQERLGDQAGIATSFGNLGTMAQRRGDYDGAEARYRQSLEIQERLGNQAGIAASFGNLGTMARLRGDYDGAEARYRQSLEIQERLGDQPRMAMSYGNLGLVARHRGDYDGAEARFLQALEIQERLGDQAGKATSFGNLGTVAQHRDDYDGAEARFRQALEIQERLGDQAGMATSFGNLGTMARVRGDYDGAEARYRQSLEIQERLGDLSGMAMAYSGLGELRTDREELEAAIALHVTSLGLRLRVGVPEAANNLAKLNELRTRVGARRFTSTIDTSLDADSKSALMALLDAFHAREAEEDAPQ